MYLPVVARLLINPNPGPSAYAHRYLGDADRLASIHDSKDLEVNMNTLSRAIE